MAKQSISRVPLWGRILILLPIVPAIVSVYLLGQKAREGLFESSLQAGSSLPDYASIRLALPVHLPRANFTLTDTIQIYSGDNLYKKIDGHDAAFLRFGFVALAFASYRGTVDAFLDVYVYRMNRRENALGIFANERSDDREQLELIDAGYQSGGGLFFYRGPWYVQIIPSTNDPKTAVAVDEMLDSLMATIPAPEAPLPQLAWFPAGGRVPLGEGYLPDDAFGTDFLGDVFTAEYVLDGARLTAFRHRSDSAAVIFARYNGFLTGVASPIDSIAIRGQGVRRYASYGEEVWVSLSGNDLIGLTGVRETMKAEALMEALLSIAMTERTHGMQR